MFVYLQNWLEILSLSLSHFYARSLSLSLSRSLAFALNLILFWNWKTQHLSVLKAKLGKQFSACLTFREANIFTADFQKNPKNN